MGDFPSTRRRAMAMDRLRLSDAATASVEYALVLFLVVVVALGAIHLVGGAINSFPAILSDQVGIAHVSAPNNGQWLGTGHSGVLKTRDRFHHPVTSP